MVSASQIAPIAPRRSDDPIRVEANVAYPTSAHTRSSGLASFIPFAKALGSRCRFVRLASPLSSRSRVVVACAFDALPVRDVAFAGAAYFTGSAKNDGHRRFVAQTTEPVKIGAALFRLFFPDALFRVFRAVALFRFRKSARRLANGHITAAQSPVNRRLTP